MMNQKSFSEILAEFSCETRIGGFPDSAIRRARWCLLDLIGAGLAGARTDSGNIVRQWAEEMGGNPQAGVFGSDLNLPAANAACINGTMAHALELDDVHGHCIGHPGVAVIPAAISAAQLAIYRGRPISGLELLEAIIVGYEVMARAGLFVGEGHYAYWHPTATLGTFGATAAASRLLGLTVDQAKNAFGLGGTIASGLRQVFVGGTLAKHFHPGRAGQNGINAALLALQGLTGPDEIFEGPMGFNQAFSGAGNRIVALAGLGETFEIETNEFKLYASCRSAHAPLEAALDLVAINSFQPAEVIRIDVGMAKFVAADSAWGCTDPATPLAARLSVPYNVAAALIDREVFLEQFLEDRFEAEEIRSLAKTVHMYVDNESERLYPDTIAALVKVTLSDNRSYSKRVNHPKGHELNPVTWEELVQKYTRVTDSIVGAQEMVTLISGLESADDLNQFLEVLFSCRP